MRNMERPEWRPLHPGEPNIERRLPREKCRFYPVPATSGDSQHLEASSSALGSVRPLESPLQDLKPAHRVAFIGSFVASGEKRRATDLSLGRPRPPPRMQPPQVVMYIRPQTGRNLVARYLDGRNTTPSLPFAHHASPLETTFFDSDSLSSSAFPPISTISQIHTCSENPVVCSSFSPLPFLLSPFPPFLSLLKACWVSFARSATRRHCTLSSAVFVCGVCCNILESFRTIRFPTSTSVHRFAC